MHFSSLMQLPVAEAMRKMYCPKFWQSFSDLSLESASGTGNGTGAVGVGKGAREVVEGVHEAMHQDGYVLAYPQWPAQPAALAENVRRLVELGFAPSFVSIFDEVWDIVDHAQAIVNHDQPDGRNTCNFDILAWSIDPKLGQSGFSPHRDRQPPDTDASFHSNGAAKYITCWIALTEATPENSCLYVIPKFADPGYMLGDDDDVVNGQDPMSKALSTKSSYQDIRALPLQSGGAAFFTHRILHWGSKGSNRAHVSPRVSLAVAFSDPNFEKPYFVEQHSVRPPFHLRVALICGQMIVYYQRFNFSRKELLFFKRCFDAHVDAFDDSYKTKVLVEYSKAIIELERDPSSGIRSGSVEETRSHSNVVKCSTSLKRKVDDLTVLHDAAIPTSIQGDDDDENDDEEDDDEYDGEENSLENFSSSSEDEDDAGFDWSAMKGEVSDDDNEDDEAVDEALDCLLGLHQQTRKKLKNSAGRNETEVNEGLEMIQDDFEDHV